MPPPKAILFDWDSTLVDSWDGIVLAWNASLAKLHKQPISRQQAIALSALPPEEIFLQVFGEDRQQGRSYFYNELRSSDSIRHLKILPVVVPLLDMLLQRKISMAAVSNKKAEIVRQEIDHLGWRKYFSAIVGSGDAANDKPHPAPVLFALEILNLPAGKDIWMVGDMNSDIEAASRAGVTPILIETTASLGLGLEGSFETYQPHHRVADAHAFGQLVREHIDTIS